MPKHTTVTEDKLSEMANEAAGEVENAGMELPLSQYVEFLESVIESLGMYLHNAKNDLKSGEGE